MSKISLTDLSKMMGVPEQDLMFKLRSIGVRVDEDTQMVDASILQGILQGKKLPQPREVILRDAEAKTTAPVAPARRRPPPRRLPGSPLRPTRRRTLIQKVEPRIKTIPVSEPPPPPPGSPAAAPPAASAEPRKAVGPPSAGAARPATPARTTPGTPERRVPRRPVAGRGPTRADQLRRLRADEQAAQAYRGSVRKDREDEEAGGVATPTSKRGQRRAQRKEADAGDEGRLLAFKRPVEGVVMLSEGMTVRDFAEKIGVKVKDLIKVFFDRGMMVNINDVLSTEAAEELALELEIETRVVSFEEEVQFQAAAEDTDPEALAPRAPVVTIMGHVDHGKTTLLDAVRSSNVTEGEFGGITQHIGAYHVDVNGKQIVFLDTPGHEAFTLMRARGARVTDLVVLVVAADDGVMPQTIEAINHARAAEVPIVIAINKIDRDNANPDKVKKELADQQLAVEEWGGDTVAVELSATTQQGIPELLEMILLTVELLELKANPDVPAQGVVLEARKEKGRGILGTVLVQEGTLSVGDIFVAGATWGRVRSMHDDRGGKVISAGPATPVEVTGFGEVPEAGDSFQVVEEESRARSIVEFRNDEARQAGLAPTRGKVSLEDLFGEMEEDEIKELRVILKADVQGSVEVLKDTMASLSTSKVALQVLHSGVGAVSTHDVLLASASNAIVVGFNVRPERNASELADREGIDIRLHTVIYELTDEMRKAMTGLLEPTFREVAAGRAEVREIFGVPKLGTVAGCHVVEGTVPRTALIRLMRDNVVVHEGRIASLRRFKDDASEVRSGFDCGIRIERYQDVKPGDVIEAFVQEEVAPTL